MKVPAVLIALVTVLLLAATGWAVYSLAIDEDIGSRAEAILEDPDEFVGDTTTVTGTVESFFPGAFTLGDSTWGEEMLIATEGAEVPPVISQREGRPRVRVTGVIRIKDDSLELVGGEEGEPFEGDPYLRATRIDVVEQIPD